MFTQREQLVQRPWGRMVPGMLEEQGGGLYGCSRVGEGGKEGGEHLVRWMYSRC